jgi:hypothetical protein
LKSSSSSSPDRASSELFFRVRPKPAHRTRLQSLCGFKGTVPNWSTRDDLDGLDRWQNLFGGRFQSLFVFAYNVTGETSPLPEERLFVFREQRYAFLGVRLEHFMAHARLISPKWETLAMPTAEFRRWAQPLDELL